jgi:hypothetical protein
MDCTGKSEMRSTTREDVRCIGQFIYTGAKTGDGIVRCNDGAQGRFSFTAPWHRQQLGRLLHTDVGLAADRRRSDHIAGRRLDELRRNDLADSKLSQACTK